MKRGKLESLISECRLKSIQILMGLLFLYLVLMTLEIPLIFRTGLGQEPFEDDDNLYTLPIKSLNADEELSLKQTPSYHSPDRKSGNFPEVSGLIFDHNAFDNVSKDEFSELHVFVRDAFVLGNKMFEEIKTGKFEPELGASTPNGTESCPVSVSVSGFQFVEDKNLMVMPCGLTLGSHITVVGRPKWAHPEDDSKIAWIKDDDDEGSVPVSQFMLELQGLRSVDGEEPPRILHFNPRIKGGSVPVSQFMLELQGLRSVDGEEPPRILHFNPRIKGDWSGKPVIELNTCYRMQWGSALRCEGWKSRADEEYVDGQVKCEKWIRDGDDHLEESKATWWLKRLVGRTKKVEVDWPFPFAENKLFVLTLSAGLEGYHIDVDGRHITSFPYRPGFTLEDATGIYINGDVSIHAIVAASLPTSHLSFAPQQLLEMQSEWQAPSLTGRPVELFIGVLSAGSHFAERMAVRKSWFQHNSIKSGKVVARFFVALHSRKEINVELMKEAKFFRDIVVVPYMDNYDLVVLKTIAICEYGVRQLGAKYIMKCDDDTFVRIDAVALELRKIRKNLSLYIGNINYYHRPLRHGKWAVTYEEWPEEEYPPYANGPGYVMSSDIAHSIVSDFEKHKLRLFKMEDVSVGMWVERFNSSTPVGYVHNLKFCQFGCIEGYYTAHYQSPRQMICLWRKLRKLGKAQCCNMR